MTNHRSNRIRIAALAIAGMMLVGGALAWGPTRGGKTVLHATPASFMAFRQPMFAFVENGPNVTTTVRLFGYYESISARLSLHTRDGHLLAECTVFPAYQGWADWCIQPSDFGAETVALLVIRPNGDNTVGADGYITETIGDRNRQQIIKRPIEIVNKAG